MPKREQLLGIESMMGKLAEIASKDPKEVRELLSAQLDLLALNTNDAALDAFIVMKDPEAPAELKAAAAKTLNSLAFVADALSRQRASLQKEAESKGEGAIKRPLIDAPAELTNDEWEKKYLVMPKQASS